MNYLNSDYPTGSPQSKYIFAFRGRLLSLLVLTHCVVSPRPFLPQESSMYLDCSQYNWYFILWLRSSHGTQSSLCERRAVTNEECSPILHHSGKSMSPKTPQSGLLEEADGTKNALQFFAAPRKSSAQSVHRRWSKQLFWIQVVSSLVHLLGVFGSVGWWRC